MYNKEIKEAFIKYYTSDLALATFAKSFFNKIEPFEESWGTDICTQNLENVQRAIDNIQLGFRKKSNAKIRAVFRNYIYWCVRNVDGAREDGLEAEFYTTVDTVKSRTVISPLHLQTYLDQVFYKESECTNDDVYRCFLWLAYGGFPEKYTDQIRTTDVDFYNMVVRYNNLEYPIYREGIRAFKNCVELNQFSIPNPRYTKEVWHDRVAGNLLLRGEKKDLPSIIQIRNEVSRKIRVAYTSGKTKIRLSYKRADISGKFYRMYQLEQVGIDPDFYPLANEIVENGHYKKTINIESLKRVKAQEYRDDYENWKLTFLQ